MPERLMKLYQSDGGIARRNSARRLQRGSGKAIQEGRIVTQILTHKEGMKMKRILLTFAFLSTLLTLSLPGLARAEISKGSQEIGIHAGALFGASSDLTDTAISGTQPELGDDFAIGLNYTYNFTPQWGLEGRYTFNPNTAEDTPTTGEIDLDLHLIDVNAVYHVNPHDPVVFYGTAGVGWAFADLDNDITGTVGGVPETISDDDGFTFNVGVGLKYEVVEHVSLRLDARYRYIDQLVDSREEQLNTAEATVGIAWVF